MLPWRNETPEIRPRLHAARSRPSHAARRRFPFPPPTAPAITTAPRALPVITATATCAIATCTCVMCRCAMCWHATAHWTTPAPRRIMDSTNAVYQVRVRPLPLRRIVTAATVSGARRIAMNGICMIGSGRGRCGNGRCVIASRGNVMCVRRRGIAGGCRCPGGRELNEKGQVE
ncbi:hypothetical protein C8J57DRAFT_1352557 [Mycena rebaudengoi]|nr:hypothetical protein C8J57DRAFT_1352557 [Mycena rebaudengoi]